MGEYIAGREQSGRDVCEKEFGETQEKEKRTLNLLYHIRTTCPPRSLIHLQYLFQCLVGNARAVRRKCW